MRYQPAIILVLTSTVLCASAQVSADCQLDGQWYDPHTTSRNAQFIFRFDGDMLFAVTPNLQWTTGIVSFTSPSITAQLDDGEIITGAINQTSCSEINWTTPVATWLKIPGVKHVHVIFMNHLDVGYNGIPQTGYINNVLNMYFKEYFPRAISLGIETAKQDPSRGFIYTTHPWLLDLYLNCPANFTLNGIQLYCPTDTEISAMEKAIHDGIISWHAGPMNMQVELMNEYVLNASLQIGKRLNEKYMKESVVLSQRDVPGMTAAAIPTLVNDFGIKGVSVGVNPSSSPPAVPKIFQWKLHTDSKESVIGMWHPGGYPLNPGSSLQKAGGLSLMDSTISEVDAQALVFAFRTDNSGPPLSLDEIHTAYDILESQFVGAQVFASTFTNFVNSVTKESLPVVVGEIGDTWIQGIASDPLKMALYRYGTKALQMCMDNSDCELDSESLQYLRLLVKLPEHTWGLPSVQDSGNWTNEAFEKYRNQANFKNGEDSWNEQRVFFNMTRELSSKATNRNYSIYLEKLLSENNLQPYPADFSNFVMVDMQKTYDLEGAGIPISITFGVDGSIASLVGKDSTGKMLTFVDSENTIGLFTYHTYNQSDYDFVNAEYGYYGNAGYNKPNVTASAHPQSGIHHAKMTALYQSTVDTEFCAELVPPDELVSYYGAPVKIRNCVQILKNSNKALFPLQMIFKASLIGKVSTRLPEATMYSFTPTLQSNTGGNQWSHQLFKVQTYSGAGKIPSGGVTLDSIVKNGSFYQHAVEELYLIDNTEKIVFKAKSVEVPLVCPIFDSTNGFETPNPLPILSRPPQGAKLRGFAFNIHNNVWDTNYPLWYPFEGRQKNIRGNFEISWDKEQ